MKQQMVWGCHRFVVVWCIGLGVGNTAFAQDLPARDPFQPLVTEKESVRIQHAHLFEEYVPIGVLATSQKHLLLLRTRCGRTFYIHKNDTLGLEKFRWIALHFNPEATVFTFTKIVRDMTGNPTTLTQTKRLFKNQLQ